MAVEMPPPAPSVRRLRQPLNGQPTSILIAALDDLPVVMRMTVSDANDPAAAKRARWVQNSARRHRRHRSSSRRSIGWSEPPGFGCR